VFTGEIAAGRVVLAIELVTTGTTGAAVLRFELDGVVQEVLVIVGNPPASQIPAVTAPAVGLTIGQ
jgi:hypothetical protein